MLSYGLKNFISLASGLEAAWKFTCLASSGFVCLDHHILMDLSFMPFNSYQINGMSFVISLIHKPSPWGLVDFLIFAALLQSSLSSTAPTTTLPCAPSPATSF